MLFKMQMKPPSQKTGNYFLYFLLPFLVSADFVVTMSFMFHLVYPEFNLSSTTATFLLFYPGLALISPLLGLLSVSLPSILPTTRRSLAT